MANIQAGQNFPDLLKTTRKPIRKIKLTAGFAKIFCISECFFDAKLECVAGSVIKCTQSEANARKPKKAIAKIVSCVAVLFRLVWVAFLV